MKTSSRGPSTTNSKKPSGKQQSGKFAFQGPKTSRQNSPPSASSEATPSDRLFSLADLKELAQIMREPTTAGARSAVEAPSTAPTTLPSNGKAKRIGYKQQIKKAKKEGAVAFQTKKGKVQFNARVNREEAEVGQVPELAPPSTYTETQENPYGYAFY